MLKFTKFVTAKTVFTFNNWIILLISMYHVVNDEWINSSRRKLKVNFVVARFWP